MKSVPLSGALAQGLGNDFQVGGERASPPENCLPPNSSFSSLASRCVGIATCAFLSHMYKIVPCGRFQSFATIKRFEQGRGVGALMSVLSIATPISAMFQVWKVSSK